MRKIVRTKTKAKGGITDKEREAMKAHADLWIKRALRTDPIEPDKIIPAIENLYAAADLKKPRVVIVPSPLVAAFAYGASAAILYARDKQTEGVAAHEAARETAAAATKETVRAVRRRAAHAAADDTACYATSHTASAAENAVYTATKGATSKATYAVTENVVRTFTQKATYTVTEDAVRAAIEKAADEAVFWTTEAITEDAVGVATETAIDETGYRLFYAETDGAVRTATERVTKRAVRAATDNATGNIAEAIIKAATGAALHEPVNPTIVPAVCAAIEAVMGETVQKTARTAVNKAINKDLDVWAGDVTASFIADVKGVAVNRTTEAAKKTEKATDRLVRAATQKAVASASSTYTRAAARRAVQEAVRTVADAASVTSVSNALNATVSADMQEVVRASLKATADTPLTDAGKACYAWSGDFGLRCAARWGYIYQAGNMWARTCAYITAMRDIIGLDLPEFKKYEAWEQAAIHGGFRAMHKDFCIVSDFPEFIKMDENHQPHCENGPSHRWRDGWELFHWHGVSVPENWIMNPESVDPLEILKEHNVEKRAAGCAILGWARMLDHLDWKTIDSDPNPDHGELIEVQLPGLPKPGRFLKARCPRNGTIFEGVPMTSDIDDTPINTVIAAQAWRVGETVKEFSYPQKRT